MAFTVEDFHDLIELLAQHPEWRAELRRYVLSDEIIELPGLVRQLVEAQARSEARLDRVEAALQTLAEAQARTEMRLDRVEAALQTLAEAQARSEARLDALADAQTRTEAMIGRIVDRLGDIDGGVMELDFARRGPAYLGPIARRLRVVEPGPLADLLDDAVDQGQLTEPERETIMLADIVLTGRRRDTGQDVYLLVEISGRIDEYDVRRSIERAALLEKLGRPVLPVVAGRQIDADVAALAQDQGVWYALGGRVTWPRGA